MNATDQLCRQPRKWRSVSQVAMKNQHISAAVHIPTGIIWHTVTPCTGPSGAQVFGKRIHGYYHPADGPEDFRCYESFAAALRGAVAAGALPPWRARQYLGEQEESENDSR